MKRVLVTGAGGFVGARILDMWRGQFALCAFPSDALRTADENAVLRFILKEHPDVIVHTAALSNTQYCQQEPETPSAPTSCCPSGWRRERRRWAQSCSPAAPTRCMQA